MYVYDAESQHSIQLAAALNKMSPDWVDTWYCDKTTLDLLECCRTLLAKNAGLRKITEAGDKAISQLEHSVSVLESENNELRRQLEIALSTAEQAVQALEDLRQERLQA